MSIIIMLILIIAVLEKKSLKIQGKGKSGKDRYFT